MKTWTIIGTLAVLLGLSSWGLAQPSPAAPSHDPGQRRHQLSSSAFMVANLFPDPPSFYQLNYGYSLTPRDLLLVEAITWTYSGPLGVPYWASPKASHRSYPGFVREYGLGLAYQRFLWRGLFGAFHATPLLRQYLDAQRNRIQSGFQLFLTLRLGYRFQFLDGRLFLEPSVACTHWPISTNVPQAFARADRHWPNYFLLEPGLNFGVRL